MVDISGWNSCESAFDESDEWIPMSASWNVASSGRLLYLRISGESGGEIEIKIDALNGSLHSLIVLEWPPEYIGEFASTPANTITSAVPKIKTDLWGPEPLDLFRVQPIYIAAHLSTHRTPEEITLVIGNDATISTSNSSQWEYPHLGGLTSFTKKQQI